MRDQQAKLNEFVLAQQGYFTTKQAITAGFSSRSHLYHVQTGTWIKDYRGVYRLAQFPVSAEGQYVLWTLWSCNRQGIPQGVYSHQTALSIHELSDVMPARLHMTVPPAFRRNAARPKILCLHKAELAKGDIVQLQGFQVVRALRAIVDLLVEENESRDHLRQSLQQGLDRGLITQGELRQHPKCAVLQGLLK
jgi:predicted transcriptional regulator of viral defense system